MVQKYKAQAYVSPFCPAYWARDQSAAIPINQRNLTTIFISYFDVCFEVNARHTDK
jgi:hypothetical protein